MFPTDYSDPEVRKVLIENAINTVRKYKDVPGVLLFLFGNESNYGLEWKSTEIENLPVGERHKAKARYLYTLFEEILKKAKMIDKNHPVAICNGDLQYIDLIAKYCKSLDILGANVYRGISATDLFKTVKEKLNLPFMFTEFGCDAFNAKTGEEDQYHQALFLKGQWQEVYHKSYGKGEEANCIGGLVFEWIDEWWKTGQSYDLEVHNIDASWENGGYYFDFEPGKNNMNEEWWGICALSKQQISGINIKMNKRVPRASYYLLQEVFKINPFEFNIKEIDDYFAQIDLNSCIQRGELNAMKEQLKEEKMIKVTGGRILAELVVNSDNEKIQEGKKGLNVSDGEMVFIDFEFNPLNNLKGTLSINILGNVPDKKGELHFYGDRGEPYDVLITTNQYLLEATSKQNVKDNERIEIYSFSFDYYTPTFDLKGFYHTGHYHWLYEGDFFGLLQEANNIPEYDLYNAKAPIGVEFIGKKSLNGLKILAGPELYWGANPKIMVKYYKNFGMFDLALIHF